MFLWGVYLGMDWLVPSYMMFKLIRDWQRIFQHVYTNILSLWQCIYVLTALYSHHHVVLPDFLVFASLVDVISNLITNEWHIFSKLCLPFRIPLLQSAVQVFCLFSFVIYSSLYIWTLIITFCSVSFIFFAICFDKEMLLFLT